MKVRELIEQLENVEPYAEVRIASLPNHQSEYAVRRVQEVYDDSWTLYIIEGEWCGHITEGVKREIGW